MIGKNTKQTVAAYDLTAKEYSERTKEFLMLSEKRTFLDHLGEGKIILDIGCGPGRDALDFTKRGYKVVGLDLSSKLLEIAAETSPTSNFIYGDFSDLSYLAKNHFGGLWASAALLHPESRSQVPEILNQWYSVLKKGGIAHISVKRGEGEEDFIDERYGSVVKHFCYFSEKEIRDLVEGANFKIKTLEIAEKKGTYQTHPFMSIYATK